MQGAEERRLRRMRQYAARRNERRQRRRMHPCESRADALMVNQGSLSSIDRDSSLQLNDDQRMNSERASPMALTG